MNGTYLGGRDGHPAPAGFVAEGGVEPAHVGAYETPKSTGTSLRKWQGRGSNPLGPAYEAGLRTTSPCSGYCVYRTAWAWPSPVPYPSGAECKTAVVEVMLAAAASSAAAAAAASTFSWTTWRSCSAGLFSLAIGPWYLRAGGGTRTLLPPGPHPGVHPHELRSPWSTRAESNPSRRGSAREVLPLLRHAV